MRPPSSCAKCGGRMSRGFLIDHSHGSVVPGTWHEGEPQKSWLYGVKTRKEAKRQVHTFRCDRCGYLESYAP